MTVSICVETYYTLEVDEKYRIPWHLREFNSDKGFALSEECAEKLGIDWEQIFSIEDEDGFAIYER